MAVDASGNVYVADTGNGTIRKVTSVGVVTTFAGTAEKFGSTDGTGAAAEFNNPEGIAVDGAGNLYVSDTGNDTIRKITPAGVVTTLAGAAGKAGETDDGERRTVQRSYRTCGQRLGQPLCRGHEQRHDTEGHTGWNRDVLTGCG